MSRTEQTIEDLKSYFRTHSKIREQRPHMSKVTITKITLQTLPAFTLHIVGSFGLLERQWMPLGFRII